MKCKICKIYTNFIHNLGKFLKNFIDDFQNFHEVFPNISPMFFSKFQQISLQNNTFSLVSLYFLNSSSVPYLHFIKIFANFWNFFLDIYSELR